jgi:cytochrome c-type biogenesis protein CcmH
MANPNLQDSPEFQLRLRNLSEELRCLVCQNQSLADANADLAVDLRREVQRLMTEGKTDAEVKAHLVARYGDFVLYKPPVQSNTALLWGGPPALLVVGAVFWRLAQRRSKAAAQNMGSPSQSQNDVAKKLLD